MITCFSRKFVKIRAALAIVVVMVAATHVLAQGGLPGEYLVTDRWRHVYSIYSGVTNPAYVNEENYMSLRFAFANTLEGFYMHEAGFAMPLGLYDAVGVAWMMQSADPYEITGNDGTPTGGKIADQGHFFALTYASNMWNYLTVGWNINIIAQNVAKIDGTSLSNAMLFGFGMDVGLSWKFPPHEILGNHMLGLSTINIFNMILDTDEQYAAAVRLSLLSDFWEKRIYYGANFVLKDILAGESGRHAEKHLKYMPWEFSQKLGFNISPIFKLYGLISISSVEGGFDHYGFAFGANIPDLFNSRAIEGIIQYVSIVGSNEASIISFYARTEFGKYREKGRK